MSESSGMYRGRRWRVQRTCHSRHGPRRQLADMVGRTVIWVPAEMVTELHPGPQCELCEALPPDADCPQATPGVTVRPSRYGLLCQSCLALYESDPEDETWWQRVTQPIRDLTCWLLWQIRGR